jgi:hypothetical protein
MSLWGVGYHNRECNKGEALSKEPTINHAPWRQLEGILDPYIQSAKRLRDLMYGASVLGMVLGVIGVTYRSPLAFLALFFVLVPRLIFAFWNTKNQPKCPGCQASLGFDWRGSPARTRAVYQEHACPSCGIPFTE